MKKQNNKNTKPKYDALVVLSSADSETSELRINKALELFDQGIAKYLVFNGFNTQEDHDSGFNGDWYKDYRLNQYKRKIGSLLKQGKAHIVHARETEENVYRTKELSRQYGWRNIAFVSSETHIGNLLLNKKTSGRLPRVCYKFFRDYNRNYHVDFIPAEEPKGLRSKRAFGELICDTLTSIVMRDLPISRDKIDDLIIYTKAAKRKRDIKEFPKIHEPLKQLEESPPEKAVFHVMSASLLISALGLSAMGGYEILNNITKTACSPETKFNLALGFLLASAVSEICTFNFGKEKE